MLKRIFQSNSSILLYVFLNVFKWIVQCLKYRIFLWLTGQKLVWSSNNQQPFLACSSLVAYMNSFDVLSRSGCHWAGGQVAKASHFALIRHFIALCSYGWPALCAWSPINFKLSSLKGIAGTGSGKPKINGSKICPVWRNYSVTRKFKPSGVTLSEGFIC